MLVRLALLCLRAFRLYYLVFEQPTPEPARGTLRRIHRACHACSRSDRLLLRSLGDLVDQVPRLKESELHEEQRLPEGRENVLGRGVE